MGMGLNLLKCVQLREMRVITRNVCNYSKIDYGFLMDDGIWITPISGADPCSTLGGIIPHFYRFFGILKFWGGYSGFADFSSFNDFENLGYIQVLTKMYLNN